MRRRDFLAGGLVLGAAALIPKAVRSLEPDDRQLTETHGWRRVQVCRRGVWTDTPWPHLCQWDIFRMFEPDTGDLVDAGTDHEISIIVRPPEWVGGDEGWRLTTAPFTRVDGTCVFSPRIRVVADGKQVGFVESVDLRTRRMVRWVPDGLDTRGLHVPIEQTRFDYIEYMPPEG
jgi:hypothetical protein